MDEALQELQRMIEDEMRRGYSEATVEHAMNPRNVGEMHGADGHSRYTGPCGDTMEIWIKVDGDKILDARFWTDGCGASIACGSMVTSMASGRSLIEAMEMGKGDVLEALGGLPEENEHCALLAATTLKLAISDCLNRRDQPWRKYYERL